MSDTLEFLGVMCGGATLLAVVSVGSVAGYSLAVDKPACYAYGKLSGQEVFYSLGTSCIVKRDGEWVDYSVAISKSK